MNSCDNADEEEERTNVGKQNDLRIIDTNARSLGPKMKSLLDCIQEISIVTETWVRDGKDLEDDVQVLVLGRALVCYTV